MGSKVIVHLGVSGIRHDIISTMVMGSTGGHWKRPVNRMYSYNYQVGESYYLPMTSYLETKNVGQDSKLDLPGPLSFSERIAVNALNDMRVIKQSSMKEVSSFQASSSASL